MYMCVCVRARVHLWVCDRQKARTHVPAYARTEFTNAHTHTSHMQERTRHDTRPQTRKHTHTKTQSCTCTNTDVCQHLKV